MKRARYLLAQRRCRHWSVSHHAGRRGGLRPPDCKRAYFFFVSGFWRWHTSVTLLWWRRTSLLVSYVWSVHAHVCGLLIRFFIYFSPQNLQWARDVLLGSSVPWQQLKHMPAQGLFCERNKTNLFNVSRLAAHACFVFLSSVTRYITHLSHADLRPQRSR